jgi:hypothetical protein
MRCERCGPSQCYSCLRNERHLFRDALHEVTGAGFQDAAPLSNGDPAPWDYILIYRDDMKRYRKLLEDHEQ